MFHVVFHAVFHTPALEFVFAFMRPCQNGVWCNPEHGVNGASVTKAAEAAQSEAVEKKDFEPQNIDAHCAHVS